MNRTKIFISSTCYDLDQVRANLKEELENIGHEPILSEYKEFPVLTEFDTIENCKRNVKENCDLFILVLGGKRGSLDVNSHKPIVNIEFETALVSSKEIFIFINKKVLDYYTLWKTNPNIDFKPYVDSNLVFEFIDRIKAKQLWIFDFERAGDIIDKLKIQLSVLLQSLLRRKNNGSLDPNIDFKDESTIIQKIVVDKPQYWEFKLTIELLRDRINRVRSRFIDMQKGLILIKPVYLNDFEFFQNVSARMETMIQLLKMLTQVAEVELLESWGKPGEPGDSVKIKKSIERFFEIGNEIFNWELEIRSLSVSDELIPLKESLYGTAESIFNDASTLADLLEAPLLDNQRGEINITYKINVPSTINLFNEKSREYKIKNGLY